MPRLGVAASSSRSLALIRLSARSDELERPLDRAPERAEPEVLDRAPDLERARHPGQLEAEVGEVDLAVDRARFLQVVGRDRERVPQLGAVADEQAAALVRLVEPLVRVERDRVRVLDPGELPAPALVEHREPAVRRVHVQPHVLLVAQLDEIFQRVDRAAVRGAAVRGDEERLATGRDVGLHRRLEQVDAHLELVARRDHANLVLPEAEAACGSRHRRMRLIGDVDDQVVGHRADLRLARARERREVRRRAAADEEPGRLLRVVQPVLEPADHLELDLARPRGLHPRARVDVRGAGDQVAERPRPGAGERDVREEPGVVALAHEREHVLVEPAEDLVPVLRLLGRGPAQALRPSPAESRGEAAGSTGR